MIYRPASPRRDDGSLMGPSAENCSGFYKVIQDTHLVVAYNSIYFRTLDEVVADLADLVEGGLTGPWGADYVIWRDGRVMAVYHQHMDDDGKRVVLFHDPQNDPLESSHEHLPGWPTYEQWVENGRGDLWFNKYNPENPAD